MFVFEFFNMKTAKQKFPKLAMQIFYLSHAVCQVKKKKKTKAKQEKKKKANQELKQSICKRRGRARHCTIIKNQ